MECGVYGRPVQFVVNGEDVSNLKNVIVQNFSGLEMSHIALLQIKSDHYNGHFVDILNENEVIRNTSVVKVLLHHKVSTIKQLLLV